MGKKNKGKGKAVVMTAAEFDKSIAEKPAQNKQPETKGIVESLDVILGSGNENKKSKKKDQEPGVDLMGRKIEDDFPKYKQKDGFGLDTGPASNINISAVATKHSTQQNDFNKIFQSNDNKNEEQKLPKAQPKEEKKLNKKSEPAIPPKESLPPAVDDEGFTLQESRGAKKERKEQEREQQIYNQAPRGRGRGRGRLRGSEVTFTAQQSKMNKQHQLDATAKAQEAMRKQYQQMMASAQSNQPSMPMPGAFNPMGNVPMPMPAPMGIPGQMLQPGGQMPGMMGMQQQNLQMPNMMGSIQMPMQPPAQNMMPPPNQAGMMPQPNLAGMMPQANQSGMMPPLNQLGMMLGQNQPGMMPPQNQPGMMPPQNPMMPQGGLPQMNPQTTPMFIPTQGFAPLPTGFGGVPMPPPQPYNPNQGIQNQQQAEQQPPAKEAPKDFASMMQQFEKTSLEKKAVKEAAEEERQRLEEEQRFNDYGDEFYDPSGQNGMGMNAQGLMGQLQQQAPNALANAFASITQNADVQAKFDQSQIGMLQNLFSQLGNMGGPPGQGGSIPGQNNNGYNPDYIEYDDEVPEGQQTETVILNDQGEEMGKVVKIGTGGANNEIPDDMSDDDDIIDYFLQNNSEWVICKYFMEGNCKYGDNCQYMHPAYMAPRENGDGYSGFQPGKKGKAAGAIEGDEECVICLEKVLANGKRFGILENCSHAFCLDCIRDWRATYDKKVKKTHYRTCPICRENSYLVIPSTRMMYDGPLKDQLLDEYCGALAEIDCKHFNKGKGYCPFQNSCFYAHYLDNGDWYDYPHKQNYIDEDGKLREYKEEETTLADRIHIQGLLDQD